MKKILSVILVLALSLTAAISCNAAPLSDSAGGDFILSMQIDNPVMTCLLYTSPSPRDCS